MHKHIAYNYYHYHGLIMSSVRKVYEIVQRFGQAVVQWIIDSQFLDNQYLMESHA